MVIPVHTIITCVYFFMPFPPQIPYIETSAKDPPLNVDAAFHEVVRVIREQPVDLKDTRKKRRRGKISHAQCSILWCGHSFQFQSYPIM